MVQHTSPLQEDNWPKAQHHNKFHQFVSELMELQLQHVKGTVILREGLPAWCWKNSQHLDIFWKRYNIAWWTHDPPYSVDWRSSQCQLLSLQTNCGHIIQKLQSVSLQSLSVWWLLHSLRHSEGCRQCPAWCDAHRWMEISINDQC